MEFDIVENEGRIEVKRGDTTIFVSTLVEEVENFIKWQLDLGKKKVDGCASCE